MLKKTFLLHAQEVLRLHFVECIDSHDCRLQSSARGEILNCHWSMIRTLSNVLFPIEYAVKSIAGTRCLSWITLSTQSGFCDITSGLLNLIFPSFTPVQQKKMFVLSQAWVRWRAACAPSVASSSSPVRSPSWSPPSPCFTRSASTGNQKYKYKYKWKNTNQTHGRHILHTRSTCTYRQAQVDIKAHQEECFLGIRSWHEGCKHLGGTEPQKKRSYSTWPHTEASQG